MQLHIRAEGPFNDPMPLLMLQGTSDSLHTWQGWAERLRLTRRRAVWCGVEQCAKCVG